jgi:hypothetical protein
VWLDRRPEQRRPLADEMVALAAKTGDTAGGQMGRWNLVLDHLEAGDMPAAGEQLARLRRQAEVTGRQVDRWWADLITASVLTAQDRVEEARELATAAAEIGSRLCPDDAGLFLAVQLFMLHWAQGRLAELRDSAERMAQGDAPVPALRGALAVLYAETGDHDLAVRAVRDATQAEGLATLRRDRTRTAILALLAHATAVCSLPEPAVTLAAELEPRAGLQVVLGPGLALLGPVSHWLARLGDVLADHGGPGHDWWKQADDEAIRWGVTRWASDRVTRTA